MHFFYSIQKFLKGVKVHPSDCESIHPKHSYYAKIKLIYAILYIYVEVLSNVATLRQMMLSPYLMLNCLWVGPITSQKKHQDGPVLSFFVTSPRLILKSGYGHGSISQMILICTSGISYQWYMYVPANFSLIFLLNKISEQIFKFNMFYLRNM